MSDLVSQLVGALEDCLDDSHQVLAQMEQIYGTNYRQDRLESQRKTIAEARAALTAAKAGGWVAVQGEPWGWAIVSNDGTTQATRARIRDFFGSHLEMPPYMQAEIDQVDREWAGLAPHRVVKLYALPAPPAQKDNT